MTAHTLQFSWYRVRTTLRSDWTAYLAVLLLVGLVGGLAMAAIAGARRTQSAFPAYLSATRSSDMRLQTYYVSSQSGLGGASLTERLARLPQVASVATAPNLLIVPLGPNGKPSVSAFNNDEVSGVGSVGGEYFSQDMTTVVAGRQAEVDSATEMVANPEAARVLGWHLGQTVRFAMFSDAQIESGANPLTIKPALVFSARLVGLVVFADQIVSDDVDRIPYLVVMTPALTKKLSASWAYPSYGLRLKGGGADVAAVETEIIQMLPKGSVYTFHVTSVTEGEVERASKPEAIALGVFGAIAGLVTLIIAGLAIARKLWAESEDRGVLRALGAEPAALTWASALGLLGAVLLGALLALAVAIGLSPLAPIGPAGQVDRSPGFAFDWTVLCAGLAVLALGLGALTLVLAYRSASRAAAADGAEAPQHGSSIVKSASRLGLPVSAVTGLRFSLESGHGRSAVPVRSALVGAVVALSVVVTTITFASGLNTLVSHPALYGWNWTYAIDSPGGNDIPPRALGVLGHEPDVAAWTGYSYANAEIDGETVPVLLGRAGAPLGPPILTGHGLEAGDQIVLGAGTLAALHKKVGDSVVLSYGSPQDFPVYVPPTKLVVVGTATMPAIGASESLHPSMGTGALISKTIAPPSFRRALTQSDPNLNGPTIVVVRLRSGAASAAGIASMQEVANAADKIMAADPQGAGDTYTVLDVQRPAEIVNYQSTGDTPALLATGLAAGAVVALGFTLAASVRRRRRDLAVLKTLGFRRRQLAVAIACQASLAAITGIVIGVPVGIALGRWLWDLFARDIYAVPRPTVPVPEVVLVCVLAVLLANIVAAVPGRMAARTPTAFALRSE